MEKDYLKITPGLVAKELGLDVPIDKRSRIIADYGPFVFVYCPDLDKAECDWYEALGIYFEALGLRQEDLDFYTKNI